MLRIIARELVGCGVLAVAIAAAACTSITGSSVASTTISTYAPVTGVEVDALELFERQGCGVASGEPFKYVVAVYSAFSSGERDPGVPNPIVMSVTDCFTDAVFENLPGSTLGGTPTFSLTVDVFDKATFDANADAINNDVGVSSAGTAAAIDAIANWNSTCVARQEPNIQGLAACDPLLATGK